MFPPPVSEQGREDIMRNIKKRFAHKPKVEVTGFLIGRRRENTRIQLDKTG
jgi:hypothetical protein